MSEERIAELEKPEEVPPAPFKMAGPTWTMEWGEKRPASSEFGWKKVEWMPLSSIYERTEELAKAQADLDVKTFASAHLMGLEQGESTEETRDRVIAELEFAINEFEQVLETHANAEKMIQVYLSVERNQILLDPSAKSSFQNPNGVEDCEQGADGIRLVPLGLHRVLICPRHLQ